MHPCRTLQANEKSLKSLNAFLQEIAVNTAKKEDTRGRLGEAPFPGARIETMQFYFLAAKNAAGTPSSSASAAAATGGARSRGPNPHKPPRYVRPSANGAVATTTPPAAPFKATSILQPPVDDVDDGMVLKSVVLTLRTNGGDCRVIYCFIDLI